MGGQAEEPRLPSPPPPPVTASRGLVGAHSLGTMSGSIAWAGCGSVLGLSGVAVRGLCGDLCTGGALPVKDGGALPVRCVGVQCQGIACARCGSVWGVPTQDMGAHRLGSVWAAALLQNEVVRCAYSTLGCTDRAECTGNAAHCRGNAPPRPAHASNHRTDRSARRTGQLHTRVPPESNRRKPHDVWDPWSQQMLLFARKVKSKTSTHKRDKPQTCDHESVSMHRIPNRFPRPSGPIRAKAWG